MNQVVIVARTRMHNDHICLGGHDLGLHFKAIRLLDRFGGAWTSDAPFKLGEVWNLRYREKPGRPPHTEDVFVMEHFRLRTVPDLKAMVLKHVQTWTGPPEALFEGTVKSTSWGSAFIPPKGRLPRHSTGYWTPEEDLVRVVEGRKVRFVPSGDGRVKRLPWVGAQEPPERIEAGALVRMSLTRLFKSEVAPEGFYVQISGVL